MLLKSSFLELELLSVAKGGSFPSSLLESPLCILALSKLALSYFAICFIIADISLSSYVNIRCISTINTLLCFYNSLSASFM
jgi:hypothetical protein